MGVSLLRGGNGECSPLEEEQLISQEGAWIQIFLPPIVTSLPHFNPQFVLTLGTS